MDSNHINNLYSHLSRSPGFAEGGSVNTNVRDRGKSNQEAIADFLGKTFDRKQGIHPEVRGHIRGVAELIPIVGDVLAAEEIYRELQNSPVNWPLIGALGGAALIGVVPGIGDAVATAIKAGARAGLKGVQGGIEIAKRLEVDPNAVGSLGGNIRLRPEAEKPGRGELETAGVQPNVSERWIAEGGDPSAADAPAFTQGATIRPEMVDVARGERGWNYSGLPEDEFSGILQGANRIKDRQRGMTDKEVDLDFTDPALAKEAIENAGIATTADVELAHNISKAVKSSAKGNQPFEMILEDALEEASKSSQWSDITSDGLADRLADRLDMPFEKIKRIIIGLGSGKDMGGLLSRARGGSIPKGRGILA